MDMIVNQGEVMAQALGEGAYPIGTPVSFSAGLLTEQGHTFPVMRDGVIMGYDTFGRLPVVLVQRTDEMGLPIGVPKTVPTPGLASFVEVIEIDGAAETVPLADRHYL